MGRDRLFLTFPRMWSKQNKTHNAFQNRGEQNPAKRNGGWEDVSAARGLHYS